MKKGFTLIELLVVIAIIGILSSVVMGSLQTARRKARCESGDTLPEDKCEDISKSFKEKSRPLGCAEYGDLTISEVPARCIEYFNKPKE